MTRPLMACIQRTCPGCGRANRIVTPDIRPSWNINCSSCGTPLVERRRFRPQLVETVAPQADEAYRPA